MLLDILEGQALPTSDREQTFAQRFGDERRQFLKKMGSIKAPLKSRSLPFPNQFYGLILLHICVYIQRGVRASCLTYSYMQANHSATATGFIFLRKKNISEYILEKNYQLNNPVRKTCCRKKLVQLLRSFKFIYSEKATKL